MTRIQYLFDEHVDPLYHEGLLRREPSIVMRQVGAADSPPKGTLDPDLLVWCEERQFILVTENRKTMPRHLTDHLNEGRHIPGILVMNQKMTIGATIEELLLIWVASNEDEYRDRIVHLPVATNPP